MDDLLENYAMLRISLLHLFILLQLKGNQPDFKGPEKVNK